MIARTCFCIIAFVAGVVALRGPILAPEMVVTLGALCLLSAGIGVGASAARQPLLLKVLMAAWLVAAVLSACFGLLQYFGASDVLVGWVNVSPLGEAFGNLRQRNQFATLLNMGVIALLWLNRSWPVGFVVPSGAAILLLSAANAASASRTGALQLVLVVVLMSIWQRETRRRTLSLGVFGVLAYATATVMLPWIAQATGNAAGGSILYRVGHDITCDSRIVLWSNVLELIATRPWFGWGWGELDFAHYIHLYAGMRFCDILDNAHNLPLQLAVELGVPIALLVCGYLLLVTMLAKPWREQSPPKQLGWCVLAVVMLHSMLEYPLWYGQFQLATGIAVGLVLKQKGSAPNLRLSSGTAFAIAFSALLVCAYALWDYHRVSQIYLPPQARSKAYGQDPVQSIRASWLFRNQARFAELTITSPSRANAKQVYDLAISLLHYSPEPPVIERLIESAVLLGLDEEARLHIARYRAAFPKDFQSWSARNKSQGPVVRD